MIVCPLISGSSGNCTYVESGKTRVLIDAGAPGSNIEDLLRRIDVDPSSLTAILATHSHADHYKGIGVTSRRFDLPVYASIGVWDELMKNNLIGRIASKNIKVFRSVDGGALDIGDLQAVYFPTPHDAYDSVGYVLDNGKTKFGFATDLGHITPTVRKKMIDCDAALLEANYDYQMLIDGPYPYPLKRRIMGPEGHLDNKDAAAFAVDLAKQGMRYIFLGHLSEHNNTMNIAFHTVEDAMFAADVDPRKDCMVYMTKRYEPSRVLELN